MMIKNNIKYKSFKKSGFTVLEVVVSIVLFVVVLAMLSPVFKYSRSTVTTMNRLDTYHDSRNINYSIANELKYSTGVLFPKSTAEGEGSGAWSHQLIFRNSINQIVLLYINDLSRLVAINYDQLKNKKFIKGRILADNVIDFLVRRPYANLVEFQVKLKQKDQQDKDREFSVSNKVNITNLF